MNTFIKITPESNVLQWTNGLYLLIGSGLVVGGLAIYLRPEPLTIALVLLTLALTVEVLRLRGLSAKVVQAREKIATENQLLVESIGCAPIAFSIYGPDDRLLAWNESYERFYREGFARYRASGATEQPHYADLLTEVPPKHLPPAPAKAYISERVALQRQSDGTPVDRYYPVGGWHRVTKFLTPHGAVAGFAVDINALKEQESALEAEIARRQTVETELRRLATTDSLTGALNRGEFMQIVGRELGHYHRNKTPFSIIVLDIDWFKSINDRFGHQVGDQVIVEVVRVIQSQIREGTDKLGRIGGEEFGVTLPGMTIDQAEQCARRIRAEIEATGFSNSSVSRITFTASLGLATVSDNNARLTTLIGEADRAMYVAKANGRNRVVVFENGMLPEPQES